MTVEEKYYENLAKNILEKFKKRRFDAYYCASKEKALEKAMELIEENSVVSFGGSQTIKDIGLIDKVKAGNFTVLDRADAANPQEKEEITMKAMTCDYYFMSSNAFTVDGELVNIDGYGNRVAALAYGPKNIIVVLGMNKLTQDRDNAIWRTQNVASPQNTVRLERRTPCAITGLCGDCYGDISICSQILITRRSTIQGRIKVILVGESLGY
ncbi:MAG: LUD domain-containing protein [Eubacteriaceae bacterium]|nr:LUD domain-containing protein [Eubacteriaceae bacterium]